MTTTAKRMTKGEAVRAIAEILARLPESVDMEDVCYKAHRIADYERDLAAAKKDWPKLNAERAEEGLPELKTLREYIQYAKDAGEWWWPVPAE